MTTKSKPEQARWPKLVEREDGVLVAEWTVHRTRYLFSDGRTVDVESTKDDSDLRGAVLAHMRAERIEGTARLADPT